MVGTSLREQHGEKRDSGKARRGEGTIREGHDFSRAAKVRVQIAALAAEGQS